MNIKLNAKLKAYTKSTEFDAIVKKIEEQQADIDEAIQNAELATEGANNSADNANDKAQYAKDQGDYAKDKGDLADVASSNANNSVITNVTVNEDGDLLVTQQDGTETNAGYVVGPQGEQGPEGPEGQTGATGNGISSITGPVTSGLVDTYTIHYTNGNETSFEVTNGQPGGNPQPITSYNEPTTSTEGLQGQVLIVYRTENNENIISSIWICDNIQSNPTVYNWRLLYKIDTALNDYSYNPVENKEITTNFNYISEEVISPNIISPTYTTESRVQLNTSNGSLTRNVSASWITITSYIPVDNSSNYCLTLSNNRNPSSIRVCFYSSNSQSSFTRYSSSRYFSTNEDEHYVRISVSVAGITIADFQLEKGTQPTKFTPYGQRTRQIINESLDNIGLQDITKENIDNLWNPYAQIRGQMLDTSTGSTTSSNSSFVTEYIPIESNIQYSYSGNGNLGTIRACFYSSNYSFISGIQSSLHFYAPSTAAYLRVSISNTSENLQNQITKGRGRKQYTPYKSQFIDMGKLYPEDIIFNLPLKTYAVKGMEMNIYFDNLVGGDYKDYKIICSADTGSDTKLKQMDRCCRINYPTLPGGNVPITISLSKDNSSISEITRVYFSDVTSSNKTILILGDSTTANGYATYYIKQDDVNNCITPTGTISSTISGTTVQHEGRSGWTIANYYHTKTDTDGNPFYNPETTYFDASYYFTNNPSVLRPDYFFINLGINDISGGTSYSTFISNLNYIINSIKEYDNTIKVCVCITIPPNYSQDAFGNSIGMYMSRVIYKNRYIQWTKLLLETYENRESENIFVVPLHSNLDTLYNFTYSMGQPNERNTSTQVIVPGNTSSVHPGLSGYYQIADSYYAFLCNN